MSNYWENDNIKHETDRDRQWEAHIDYAKDELQEMTVRALEAEASGALKEAESLRAAASSMASELDQSVKEYRDEAGQDKYPDHENEMGKYKDVDAKLAPLREELSDLQEKIQNIEAACGTMQKNDDGTTTARPGVEFSESARQEAAGVARDLQDAAREQLHEIKHEHSMALER